MRGMNLKLFLNFAKTLLNNEKHIYTILYKSYSVFLLER